MRRIIRRSHAYEWGVHWTRRWRVRAHTRKCALAEGRRAPSAVKYPRPHWLCALMTSPITKLYERDTAGEFEYLEYHTLLRKISVWQLYPKYYQWLLRQMCGGNLRTRIPSKFHGSWLSIVGGNEWNDGHSKKLHQANRTWCYWFWIFYIFLGTDEKY